MAGSFGGTVKLKGESEYKKALSNITSQLQVVSSEMVKVSATFDKNDKSVQSLTSKDEILNKKLQAQQEKVKVLNEALQNAKNEYGETDSRTLKWQKDLNYAEAAVIKTQKEIDNLGKELEDASEKMSKSGDGFTVFKGILSNLGTQAINGALNGLKALGSTFLLIGKQALTSYADYEQLVGGIDTLFKDNSQKVQQYANQAYKTAGLSANNYMETVTSFSASLLQSLNNDTSKASEAANQAVIDMSDNANKMGTSMESIQYAYQGFAKQNYTMLDNLKLGYGGTKEEMQRLLSDAEKISGQKYDLSNLNDVYSAIHVIQGELGITGTTAKEASSTISGSISSWKSAYSNLLTGIADDNANFDEIIGNFVDSSMTVVDNIMPRIKTIFSGLVEVTKQLLPEIAAELPELLKTILPTLISGTVDLIKALSDSLPTLLPVLFDGLIQALSGISDVLPTILESLIQSANLIVQSLSEQLPVIIPQLIEAILQMIPILYENLPLFVSAGSKLILGLAQGLLNSIPTLVSYLPRIGSSMLNYLKQLPSMVVNIGSNMVKGLWEGIKNVTGWLWDKIKGFTDKITKKFKDFFGIKSPSRLFRDQIGTYLAQGIGVGFTDEMKDVTKQMENALPTNFDIVPTVNAGFSSSKQYVAPNYSESEQQMGNFTAVINNNSKYTTPADNVRLLRQQYELYNLKYGKVGA